jgi:NAD-dependent deacetylase
MVIDTIKPSLKEAIALFKTAAFPIAFTGAGISTPSGIPDFRSKGIGLWEKFDPMQVASHSAWQFHPERFYDWLRPLIIQSNDASPNTAHFALAGLEKTGKVKAILTQNVDGLHQRAGSQNVIELHGSFSDFECPRCEKHYSLSNILLEIKNGGIPKCRGCQSILKPGIVLYEEFLPEEYYSQAEDYCQTTDLILVIGSSLEVVPAASLPLNAVRNGARMIINNFSPTPYDSIADVIVRENVTEFLPELMGAFA